MSQQCSWPTHSWPLEGRCPYYALLGLTQAPGLAGGPDYIKNGKTVVIRKIEREPKFPFDSGPGITPRAYGRPEP